MEYSNKSDVSMHCAYIKHILIDLVYRYHDNIIALTTIIV